MFYVPVNRYGHVGTVSSPTHTFSSAVNKYFMPGSNSRPLDMQSDTHSEPLGLMLYNTWSESVINYLTMCARFLSRFVNL